MAITLYDVIRGAVLSDKAQRLNAKLQQLVLNVHIDANKPLVKEALEKLFNVKVKQVRMAIRKGKQRLVRRRVVVGQDQKRAIVTLAEGYSLNMPGQVDASVQASQVSQPSVVAAKD